ncbi:hypothetical protein chiPu_0032811, partial [Chiloscyllium punctatum]|nr:hypothetical protein [Chiloscyllium punctatum]
DAAIGPEIHHHDLAAQVGELQRLRVEPVADPGELGRGLALFGGHGDRARHRLRRRVGFGAEAGDHGAAEAKAGDQSGYSNQAQGHRSLLVSSQADLAVGIELGQPRHDQRVVLQVGQRGEADDHDAEALLQARRDPRHAAHAGGDGLPAIGNGKHRDRGADRVS